MKQVQLFFKKGFPVKVGVDQSFNCSSITAGTLICSRFWGKTVLNFFLLKVTAVFRDINVNVQFVIVIFFNMIIV